MIRIFIGPGLPPVVVVDNGTITFKIVGFIRYRVIEMLYCDNKIISESHMLEKLCFFLKQSDNHSKLSIARVLEKNVQPLTVYFENRK